MHPIYTKFIYKYYLNYNTVYLEYRGNVKIYNKYEIINGIDDALIVAAGTNSMIVVKWCLLNGADINYRSMYHDYTCLEIASKFGNLEIIELLLDKGITQTIHYEALRDAAEFNHLEIVKLYLRRGFDDIHFKLDQALRWASYRGHLDIVRFLLDNGADIHASYDLALRWAAYNDHLNVSQLLLDRGANLHSLTNHPFFDAKTGLSKTAKFLLSR